MSVRSTFTTAVTGGLQSADGNGAWSSTLNELEALRTTEGGGLTHYVGVVSTTYGSGMAGLAYDGRRTSVNWDKSGWDRVRNSRQIFGGMVAAARVAEGPSLWARQSNVVIWSTVQHGTATLQPAAVVETTPSVPGAGMRTYSLDMVTERGSVMRSMRFDASQADHQRAVAGFATAIPLAWMSYGPAEVVRQTSGPIVVTLPDRVRARTVRKSVF